MSLMTRAAVAAVVMNIAVSAVSITATVTGPMTGEKAAAVALFGLVALILYAAYITIEIRRENRR